MLANHGALGATFHLARLFEVCSLVAIIGMTANFISEIVSNDLTPPNVLIGTITVVNLRASFFQRLCADGDADLHRSNLLLDNHHPVA